MVFFPLLRLLRFTKCNPMKSKPSVTRVTRVLSRFRVRSIRLAIASNAARADWGLLRHTRMASSVQRCPQLRRVASPMPQLIEQVQGDVAIQRRDGRALRHPDLRWHDLPVLVHSDLQRLLDQLQETAISNPLGDQRHELTVRDAGEVRLEV